MAEEKLKLKDKIKALEENLEFKNAEWVSIFKNFSFNILLKLNAVVSYGIVLKFINNNQCISIST